MSSFPNLKSKILNLKWLWLLAGLALVGVLVVWGVGSVLLNLPNSKATATAPVVALATTRVPISPSPRIVSDTPAPSPTFTAIPTETQTPTPTGPPNPLVDEKGVTMALIPAGEFLMGSPDSDSDEKPQHRVSLDAYYIDVYEVTNARYASCVSAGECTAPAEGRGISTRSSYYGSAEYENYPVIYVDWNQVTAYCAWRGGRLPTEAEWERAARGGLEGKKYPWGDDAPVCTPGAKNGAQFYDCLPDDTVAVGSFAANDYGLFDMAGNVWEWVQDWYNETYYSSQTVWSNPDGPGSGQYRVVRGGGWFHYGDFLRAAYRGRNAPSSRYDDIGFRCARSQ